MTSKVSVNGIDLEYRLEGPHDAPLVTLSHALATELGNWDAVIPLLCRGHRVLRYSLRGHGHSDHSPGPYTLELLADDLAGLLEHLEVERTHLVGLSIGGMIAQAFALRHPQRLRGLVIASSLCQLPQGADQIWHERLETVRRRGVAALAESTLARWFTAEYAAANPGTIARVRRMIEATSAEGYLGCAEAIRHMDLIERISAIRSPTLVLVGRQDPGTPVAASEEIQARIPGARLEVLDPGSHQLPIERARRFEELVAAFLAAA
jgi:3-oxoadipate enol-lactonase